MAPNRKLLYKGDVNRIYDDEYKAEQSAKKEKLFIIDPVDVSFEDHLFIWSHRNLQG